MHFIGMESLDHLHDHVRFWIEAGGYPALFGILLACGLGFPVPEDVPLITAGVLISQHLMRWKFAAPLAWMGIIGGDCILYRLGFLFGHNITRVPIVGTHITMPRLKRLEILFAKYGVLVVGIGRLFAGVRGAMVVAAGTTRYKFIKFIIADSIAAVFSGGIFMCLGWWFGSNADMMARRAHEFKLAILGGGILLAVTFTVYFWLRNKYRKTRGFETIVEEIAESGDPSPLPTKSADQAPI